VSIHLATSEVDGTNKAMRLDINHGEGPLSEELGRSTSVFHSDERDPSIRNRREHGDRGPVVQWPSEIAPERASGGGQDGGDTHKLVQSGRSGGKSWCSGDIGVCIDRY